MRKTPAVTLATAVLIRKSALALSSSVITLPSKIFNDALLCIAWALLLLVSLCYYEVLR